MWNYLHLLFICFRRIKWWWRWWTVTAVTTIADAKCQLMPSMLISGGGMNSLTPASYFTRDSFTLQVTIIQVGLNKFLTFYARLSIASSPPCTFRYICGPITNSDERMHWERYVTTTIWIGYPQSTVQKAEFCYFTLWSDQNTPLTAMNGVNEQLSK